MKFKIGDLVRVIETEVLIPLNIILVEKGEIVRIISINTSYDSPIYEVELIKSHYSFFTNEDKLKALPEVDTPLWKLLNE